MTFLEVDRTSMESKLLLNEEGSSMDSLLSSIGSPSVPTKLITPTPGLCIKTFTKSQEKVFINVCHTDEIPPPKGATIPMSIGSEKEVTDKSGEPCVAFDVALNSTFFNNNKNEIVMLTIINGIADKHGIDLDEDRYVILKNIKYKGKISPMNIEQRPVKQDPPKQPLISEIITKEQKVPARESNFTTPDYNLIKIDGSRQFYATEIDLKDVTSKDEINLQLGEDRVYLATNGKMKYELEYHFPETVNSDLSAAEFDPVKQILTVVAPLK
ncbi:PIH1 domain-containing protein 1-like [Planococcus citri]|uniref:PIH1 domain-containing protein 1-like n=1 Tax=Planococcus citri TaxID=170843 RepID=UPI0031F7CE75